MSFIFIMTTNLFLFYSACFNRGVSLKKEFMREDLKNIDLWVVGTIVGYIFLVFGMFNLKMIQDPGYLPKKELD